MVNRTMADRMFLPPLPMMYWPPGGSAPRRSRGDPDDGVERLHVSATARKAAERDKAMPRLEKNADVGGLWRTHVKVWINAISAASWMECSSDDRVIRKSIICHSRPHLRGVPRIVDGVDQHVEPAGLACRTCSGYGPALAPD